MAMREDLIALYKDGFPEDSDEFVEYFFSNVYDEKNVITRYDGDMLVSAGHIVMKKLKLYNKVVDIPFLVAVATRHELRGKRLVESVMRDALGKLSSYPFVMLYPFKHEYYRKYGFETVANDVKLDFSKIEKKKETDANVFYRVYREYLSQNDITIYRDIEDIRAKLESFYIDSDESELLIDGGKCVGYTLRSGDYIDELVMTNNIDDLAYSEGNMARLLDIPQALMLLDYDASISTTFALNIRDEFMTNSIVLVSIECGKATAEYIKEIPEDIIEIDTDIRELTSAYFGYRVPNKLAFLPKPQGVNFTDKY